MDRQADTLMKAVHPHPIMKVLLSLLCTIFTNDGTVWQERDELPLLLNGS
jgi:hypothetical protein